MPTSKPQADGPATFLLVARMLGDKGVREFVEAARLARPSFPEARFQLLGPIDDGNRSGIGRDELDRWVQEGIVEYHGVADDVRPFVAAASAIVLPSYREGLPRTLLEGAAMARPLIASDVPGCRELVEDGLNGYLCKARDPDSLAAAMVNLNVIQGNGTASEPGFEDLTTNELTFAGEGRVTSVETESGRVLDADLVVMGTGAMPDVMLARSSGLELGETGGVACSSTLATSAPGVWCAGDACEYDSVLHGRRVRIEHWEVARAQGKAAAAAVAGRPADFDEVPYFWSDLADWATLEYVGTDTSWDREIVRGSFDSGAFAVFYLLEGRLAGALSVGRPEDLMHARRLLAAGGAVRDPAVLEDEGADLSEL